MCFSSAPVEHHQGDFSDDKSKQTFSILLGNVRLLVALFATSLSLTDLSFVVCCTLPFSEEPVTLRVKSLSKILGQLLSTHKTKRSEEGGRASSLASSMRTFLRDPLKRLFPSS